MRARTFGIASTINQAPPKEWTKFTLVIGLYLGKIQIGIQKIEIMKIWLLTNYSDYPHRPNSISNVGGGWKAAHGEFKTGL